MELKSIIGLAGSGRAIPRGSGGAWVGEAQACCWGLLRAAARAGRPAGGRKAPASSELIKKSFQTSAG